MKVLPPVQFCFTFSSENCGIDCSCDIPPNLSQAELRELAIKLVDAGFVKFYKYGEAKKRREKAIKHKQTTFDIPTMAKPAHVR